MIRTLFLLFAVMAGPQVNAETSAILIGVSDYDDASGIEDLQGPKNDVVLLRDVLRRRGIDDIQIIADGVEGGTRPTKAAILQALASKAQNVTEGDFVYIHYSGHGTQQPDQNGDEADGLDEVLLPIDAAKAKPGTAEIQNALVDDELGAAIAAIRQSGAQVWVVLDSCNSGTGLRAASLNVADRYVSPKTLGVGAVRGAIRGAAIGEAPTPEDLPNDDGIIAFYAAQSSERAREVNFATQGAAEEWYGLFSARMAAELDRAPSQSHRQLFQATLRAINDKTTPGAARLQTPSWEGGLINAAVLGGSNASNVPRFDVYGDKLLAGRVHGLGPGAVVGLTATATDEEILSYAQIEEAEAAVAYLRPVDADCLPGQPGLCPRHGTLPANAQFAQIVALSLDAVVVFSDPLDGTTGAPLADDHPMVTAFDQAFAKLVDPVRRDSLEFDVAVTFRDGKLWFGQRSSVQDQLIGPSWHPDEGNLAKLLTRIARAESLVKRLTAISDEAGFVPNPQPIDIVGQVRPSRLEALVPAQDGMPVQEECEAASTARDPSTAEELDRTRHLKQCDYLTFRAQALREGVFDLNRIHVSTHYCVKVRHLRLEGSDVAKKLGSNFTVCSDCPSGYAAGDERMIILISEAAPNTPALNLRGAVETCEADLRNGDVASAAARSFMDALKEKSTLRSDSSMMGVTDIWVDQYRWTIMPKALVLK